MGLARIHPGLDLCLGVQILHELHSGAGEELGVSRLFHPALPHRLANDNLNVLVVDVNALLAVRLLDFLNQVVVDRRDPANPQDLMGRQRTLGELIPLLDPVAVLAADAGAVRQGIADHLAVVGGDGDVANGDAFALLQGDPAADLRQLGHLFGLAGLEKLLNTGQTLGDVAPGHAAGVEGPHGQLRARLSDGLCSNNSHCFSHTDRAAGGHIGAVAFGADA